MALISLRTFRVRSSGRIRLQLLEKKLLPLHAREVSLLVVAEAHEVERLLAADQRLIDL